VAREPRRRIDQPRDPRRSLPRLRVDSESLGRSSERIARFIGTWKFIGYMSVFIAAWIVWNSVVADPLRFDTYENKFTLLTLILSLQASYAAPLILLAQNRQSDRDRVQYEEDRARNERTIADTEFLAREIAALRIALGEVATRDFLRSELQRVIEEIRADPDRH
jgi:uncharacterized membrane protein